MKVLYGIEAAQAAGLRTTVVTAGTFDGVHVGHKRILQQLIAVARSCDGISVVITYDPHPRQVLPHRVGDDVRILSTLDEKISLLEAEGVDALLVLPFTLAFSQQTSAQYIADVVQGALQTHTLVIGYDHRFGRNREGSFAYLQANASALGFDVIEIPRHDVDHVGVSSTRIRHALLDGDLETANTYLGRPYTLSGTVVKGQQLGRTLGYPTANIEPGHADKLVPAIGVYACWVTLPGGGRVMGALSIGNRPAVGGTYTTIEVYLLDYEGDLYGQDLTLSFVKYLRPEWNFDSLEALKLQIGLDVAQVRTILSSAAQ